MLFTPNNCSIFFILLVVSPTLQASVYFSPCSENANRRCPSDTNQTDFLLSMKKGGTNILSTSIYNYDFFMCEQYNYDCGYMEESSDYVTVSNGVTLDINQTVLAEITTLTTTENKLKPYIGAHGDTAKCGMLLFPLHLTGTESKEILDGYMTKLVNTVIQSYDQDRNIAQTKSWTTLNINIRTAILQKLKSNKTMIRNSTFWTKIVQNDWTSCSKELKHYYQQTNDQIDLHASYMIDAVTQKCNKLQSVNFLVDESGSIGAAGFQLALDFLQMYANETNDDFSKMSLHFYDSSFDPYIDYGKDKAYFMSKIPIKPYRSLGTLTGGAINATVDKIIAGNFQNGLPKILVVMTDGVSYDSVLQASRRARSYGIIPIAVGIGSNVDTDQLLQIAQTSSNYIQISSYADLPKLVEFISNYFCKQITTIKLNQTYYGNFVRVPQSPSFFRVEKSPSSEGQIYELDIEFLTDPRPFNQSADQSQIDPFPDEYSQYKNGEYYEIYDPSVLQSGLLSAPPIELGQSFKPRKVYFIKPEHLVNYTVKKDILNSLNVTVSYVAVRGNNLQFNISLKNCTTLKCDVERAYYSSIFNRGKKDTTESLPVILIPPEEDLSIFIIIGSTLGALAALCLLFICLSRRLRDDQQKKKKLKAEESIKQGVQTNQNIEQNLVPVETTKKIGEKLQIQTFSHSS